MQPFRSFKSLLALSCVVLICATAAHATNAKKPVEEKTRTSPKGESKRGEAGAKIVSKPAVAGKAQAHSKSQSAATSKSRSSHSTAARSRGSKRRSGPVKPRGQQAIDTDRAREIQSALIRQKYLEGEATGVWDTRTRAAMVRYQSDNGWQTKVVPDSRALIKLGLGPKHANLINPETAAGSGLLPEDTRAPHPGGSPPDE